MLSPGFFAELKFLKVKYQGKKLNVPEIIFYKVAQGIAAAASSEYCVRQCH